MRLPTRKSEILKRTKLSDGPVYLTKEGIERIHREIERIKRKAPEAREEVHRTHEMGDLSENAAYQDAKHQLRRMNNRLIVLEERLKIVVEIKKDGSSESVQLGSTVILDQDGKEKKFTIVGPLEANPMKGFISYVSPLGSELLNRKVGEKVEISEFIYTIMDIQ